MGKRKSIVPLNEVRDSFGPGSNKLQGNAVNGFLQRIERMITPQAESLPFELGLNPFNPLSESVDSPPPPTRLPAR